MGKKLNYQEVKEYIESFKGYKLLSDLYINASTKLQIQCPEGHIFEMSYNNFKNGHRCPECNKEYLRKIKQIPIEKVYELIKNKSYKFIKWIDEYKNNTSKFLLRCKEEHEFESCYAYLNRNIECPYCFGRKYLNIEYIKEEFKKRDYTLISTEYVNAHSKLKYICNKHPDNIQEINWNNFKCGKGCKYCGIEKYTKSHRLSQEEVFKKYKEKGLIIENGEQYTGIQNKIKCRCKNHPEIVQEISYANLLQTKFSCKYCYLDAYRGENSPVWKGGVSSLREKLRDYILEWKENSMKYYNFRCVLTKGYFDVVHHPYNFHKIVDEVFEELNLEQYDTIGKYSDKELESIKKLLLEKHYFYGYGLPLCNCLHDLYHKIYNKYDNTKEEFEEFCERYKNFEFDDLLDEKYKYKNVILKEVS